MKKIAMTFALKLNDNSITAEAVREALSQLGVLEVLAQNEIVVTPKLPAHTHKAVIYISADEDEPYQLVASNGDREGRDLSDQEVDALRYFGVCEGFYATYPRADRCGAPRYASEDVFAEAIAAEHLFPVNYNGLEVSSEDSGDDSSEVFWLTIAIPKELHADLTVA